MSVRPGRADFLVIGRYTSLVIVGVGMLMVPALVTSMLFSEWDTVLDFVISIMACLAFGLAGLIVCRTRKEIAWKHGLVVASGSWIWATLLGALPHYLSGHAGSYLDAVFDAISGYTTTGLFLLQDLDHISNGLNMWRHVLTYAGGQGIVVIALTFLFKGASGAYTVYVGEGKDERLLPNVVHTARAIWLISLVWLAVGWIALSAWGLAIGQSPVRAVLDGLWMFMGGWSTGGFAPRSYNAYWYHSVGYEVVSMIVMVAGSFNFALHWAVWTGDRREIRRNVELVSMAVTLTAAVVIATFWLARAGVYPDAVALFRKTFYQLVSGHTTTGSATIYAKQFISQWGPVGMLVTTFVMMIGASAASTAGGIKGMRVGIIFSALVAEMRRLVSPPSAVVKARYHHVKTHWADDGVVKTALMITVLYLASYLFVALLGVLYGYDLSSALFEGVSAVSNTGLSCGLTDPTMPAGLKIAYIVLMWMGRLEFMSVFALLGFGIAVVRGR